MACQVPCSLLPRARLLRNTGFLIFLEEAIASRLEAASRLEDWLEALLLETKAFTSERHRQSLQVKRAHDSEERR